ncbi:hypothetical protein DASC09_015310 [Saccharomycopsis crataegensis]|uniref:4-hydroxyphenylpyruvate dioxygenase n=1 Tax=Saccharomycopsis crataegensis TaxID=43959 RepID=A0AAV5QHP2_9ASCO|nr:hypothetical protein DASC09_015310 [Saccharomycopsis crataegensis]
MTISTSIQSERETGIHVIDTTAMDTTCEPLTTPKHVYTTQFEKDLSLIQDHLLPNIKLEKFSYEGYDHVTWYVSNSKQASAYFITCLGFKPLAYKGLETGSRAICCHVVTNGKAIFQFVSPLRSEFKANKEYDEQVKEINNFIVTHGDGAKDVAFTVDDVDTIFSTAIENGAKAIEYPETINDEFGSVRIAKVGIFGDTTHTLVNRSDYIGPFLPGYLDIGESNVFNTFSSDLINSLPKVDLIRIDHCVQNQGWNKMDESCEFYAKAFGFHRFWSVDERDVSTEYSALKSIVMAANNDVVKMPINEPAKGKFKSQIEEFIDYYNGPGVQHIAILTDDIISAISAMKQRGCEFIEVPDKYYDDLRKRLGHSNMQILQPLEEIQKLGILVDFDDNGYLLQLFTKPLVVRPTVFVEVIERHNHNGFGAGNFKALFETIEHEQKARGNLTSEDIE